MIRIVINLEGIKHLRRKLLENPPWLKDAREAVALLYRSFVRNRFARASKGDGTWTPLADSTLRGRRRGRGRGAPAILRDTGALFAATNPSLGSSGLVQSIDTTYGVEMTLGGSPLATIASYHDQGGPHLPQRVILAEPDQATQDKMATVIGKIAAAAANGD